MFQRDRDLSCYSTFGIGGPARYFVTVRSKEELLGVLEKCEKEKLSFFVLGKGSNCLFDDRGFAGVVIQNKIDYLCNPSQGVYEVGAGYSFSRLGALTARKGFTGLEFASGIPGTVGGAVFMNAGANGHETCETLTRVTFLTKEGKEREFARKELTFSYRTSPFQQMEGVITSATFCLKASDEAKSAQLKLLYYRKSTQPYTDKSAGCIFRNPERDFAGGLIEKCGLKGFCMGGAQVSDKHANFIVNKGNARSKDVLALIAHIQGQVQEKTGKTLLSEVRYIPYEGEL